MQNYTGSPFGSVDRDLMDRLCKAAGLRYENGQWVIVSDRCEFWQKSREEKLRSNESRWYRGKGYLPIRYYNFEYALEKCGSIKAALPYAEEKLFHGHEPVYLPDLFNQKAGFSINERHYSYKQILDELKAQNRKNYQN